MTEIATPYQPDEALVDLLIKQVTEGLSPAEQRALDVMDGAPAAGYRWDLEKAAAAVSLAGSVGGPPLPASLLQRLSEQAEAHVGVASRVVNLDTVRAAAQSAQSPTATAGRPASGSNYGWIAAAACLLLAVFGWMRSPAPQAPPIAVVAPPAQAPVTVSVPPTPLLPATPAEKRSALLAQADSLKITLGATKDSAASGVTGDVVWDPTSQQGYLHFVGLASNDPAVRQYQIWIFDGGRDKRYPVDGGVFDVPANYSEVVIPIRATLPVLKLAAFAVTVEKPGGAVVSGREHIVALGAATG